MAEPTTPPASGDRSTTRLSAFDRFADFVFGIRTGPRGQLLLTHFEGILQTELRSIDTRRALAGREPVRRLHPPKREGADREARAPHPPPAKRVPDASTLFHPPGGTPPELETPRANPHAPDKDKMRPMPVPCDAVGLSLSGGGIRSAAVCLGALQAIASSERLGAIDYMSTVSGGGYIGACLSAAMSRGDEQYPFGRDVSDSPWIAHLRNYSNYLMPRGRGTIKNGLEAASVILRGLLANFLVTATLVLFAALVTSWLFPKSCTLHEGMFRLVAPADTTAGRFAGSLTLAALLSATLLLWAILRSAGDLGYYSGDTRGAPLIIARNLLRALVCMAVLEVQPFVIAQAVHFFEHPPFATAKAWLVAPIAAISPIVSWFASNLGHFLQTSERTPGLPAGLKRGATKALVLFASSIVPSLIYASYLVAAAALILDSPTHGSTSLSAIFAVLWAVGTLISLFISPNSYSLHSFYRGRLGRAFLGKSLDDDDDDAPKLSELQDGCAPYHIVNAALNVQGSKEANKRGRDADFFVFTPHFIGSDLTMYAPNDMRPSYASTETMEQLVPALDLGTAMAVSGAAISANMGSATIRTLSPTLALLNCRLGYWMLNPRFHACASELTLLSTRVVRLFSRKFDLFRETFNLLDETRPEILLTDGGHIDNLGLYELLKRGCGTLVVIDAEADPELAFPSLMRVERYARIDLGVRLEVPWEQIALAVRASNARIAAGALSAPGVGGPHCAIGRVVYATGEEGRIIYMKSCVTGDEKDYLIDYKRRNPAFPHETTGDQFFTEEQFEVYRALGFHMLDGLLSGTQPFARLHDKDDHQKSDQDIRTEVLNAMAAVGNDPKRAPVS